VNGGALVYALPADPVLVTPLYGGDAAGLVIERNVFAGLVDADPSTLRTVPVIARSWSSTPDARTYTFRLRPHVSFPGGAGAVTATTFVADWTLLCRRSIGASLRASRRDFSPPPVRLGRARSRGCAPQGP
jgi:peptide/nickel transport system substrate-binding protein